MLKLVCAFRHTTTPPIKSNQCACTRSIKHTHRGFLRPRQAEQKELRRELREGCGWKRRKVFSS